MRDCGGRATTAQIDSRAIAILCLPEAAVILPHSEGSDNRTELKYRLAWARTYAKKQGLLEADGIRAWKLSDASR